MNPTSPAKMHSLQYSRIAGERIRYISVSQYPKKKQKTVTLADDLTTGVSTYKPRTYGRSQTIVWYWSQEHQSPISLTVGNAL